MIAGIRHTFQRLLAAVFHPAVARLARHLVIGKIVAAAESPGATGEKRSGDDSHAPKLFMHTQPQTRNKPES